MEFGILGPLEVRADGRPVALGGARPRAVFAVLALHPNQPMSAERLAVALWGEDVPPSAVKTVQVYVARLRKALDDPDVLVTTGRLPPPRAPGNSTPSAERQVAVGRQALAAGRAEHAAAQLREPRAVARPRSPSSPPRRSRQPRSPAEEEAFRSRRGARRRRPGRRRHAELVGELQQLTTQHPWRERLHAHLMLALYRSGRQADALEAYRHARDVLVDQLGIEPGADTTSNRQFSLTTWFSMRQPRQPRHRLTDGTADRPAWARSATTGCRRRRIGPLVAGASSTPSASGCERVPCGC